MPTEKGKLGPQPSKKNLLKDGAAGRGGDGAGSGARPPPPSHTSRVSFSSRLQVQESPSPVPPVRRDKPPRTSRVQLSTESHPGPARPLRAQGSRSAVPSPVPLAPPSNTAARGQHRRLRSCVACSGKATPDTPSALPSTPPTPASTDTEPSLVHQLTQTEPPGAERWGAAERVDRDTQTESPAQERRNPRVRPSLDRETQTETQAEPPLPRPSRASAAPGGAEPPGLRQRPSLFRRMLRACRCTRAQPEQLGASCGLKRAQRPLRAAQGRAAGFGLLMVLQESDEAMEWPLYSWPWLVETSL